MLTFPGFAEVERAPADQTENRTPESRNPRTEHLWVKGMLSVAIAIEPPTASAAVVQAVTQSCEEAIGDGRCKAASDNEPATVVTWFALIRSPDAEVSAVSIEFRDRSQQGALIESRELTFSEGDSLDSRWASAGAVIAAFVAAREPASDVAAQPSARVDPPRVTVESPPTGPSWNIDVALLAGPGLESGPLRVGALARGYLAFPPQQSLLGLVSLRYAERPGDVALGWWSAGCGIGARLGGPSALLGAELTGEVVFERLALSATDEVTLEEDSATQNRFGGRLSANLALSLADHWALLAGVEASALRPAVSIEVGDRSAGREPAVGFAFSSGARFGGGP
jgi:hypothetical protein